MSAKNKVDGRDTYKAKHKKLGLCQLCPRPRVENSVRCRIHLDSQRERGARDYDEIRKTTRRNICHTCLKPGHNSRRHKTDDLANSEPAI